MTKLLADATGLFIDGEWRVADERLQVLDKYTQDIVRDVAQASTLDTDAAVANAARMTGSVPGLSERSRILTQAADILGEHKDEIVANYVAETGFTTADAVGELGRTQSIFRLSAEEALRIAGEEIPVSAAPGSEHRLAFTMRVPLGVVCAIAPFNAPLSTVAHKVAPAIAAGNSVVLKPAVPTPLSAMAIAEALRRAGLPDGMLSLVCGSGSGVGAQLVADRRIRYFTFTGSTAVGLAIKQQSGIAKTHLELGSNSATIVADDADLELVSRQVGIAGYRKAGQVCTSVQRLLVDRRVADALTERLAARVRALNAGDPRSAQTNVGPMISEKEAIRAERWVAEAAEDGGRLVVGGERNGAVLKPTLLDRLPEGNRLLRDEIFAPVVAIVPVDGIEHAIGIVNAGQYGLQAGIFTQDIDRAFHAAKRLEVGGVIINDTSSYHADAMPYGGVKDSGYGVEGPKYAITDMTHPRVVVLNLRSPA